MENPKYDNHQEACSKGGIVQSQNKHWCPLCKVMGEGNRFLQFHVQESKCEGKGFKNKKSKRKWKQLQMNGGLSF